MAKKTNDAPQGGWEAALPQDVVDKLMAAYKANPSLKVEGSETDAGKTYTQDPAARVGQYTISLDPNTGKPVISAAIKQNTWGSENTAVYNPDGSFAGYSSGDGTGLGLAKAVALSAGAYYGAGALNGATGAAAGGTSAGAVDAAALGLDGAVTAGGTSAGAVDAAALGLDGLASGGAATTAGGATAAGSGGVGLSEAGTAVSAASKVADASKTTTAVDGFDLLTKAGGALVASGVVGEALSDPVDTSRYDQLFDNLIKEQGLASQRSADMWADYQNIWKPAQQKFADAAMGYDTTTRRETAADSATGQVASSYDQQRQQAERDMISAGLDPSTIQALGASSRIVQAKDEANAANSARDNVEKTGLNLLQGAVNQGNTIVGQGTQQSQVATGTTQAASGILNAQGNLQNQNTQNRNAMIGDLFGAVATGYGMYTSSKKTKRVGGKVDGLAAAKAVEKSPAKNWSYKDGQGDGNTKPRVGPMAEDLKLVAPQVSNGKQVDAISQLGLHHAAIGALSKQMGRIEKKLGSLADARRA